MTESEVDPDFDKDKALRELISNTVVLLATAQRVHPTMTDLFDAVRNAMGQLIALSLGPEWMEKNDKKIDIIIHNRMVDLKKAMTDQAAASAGFEAGHG